jgi:hypothetical protein
MEKLTELAKKKSLFDDRAGEIDELSTIIRQVCLYFHLMHSFFNQFLGHSRSKLADQQSSTSDQESTSRQR